MLPHLIVGPFSTLHTLPTPVSTVLVVITTIIASISLGVTGVQAGKTRAPEIANLTLSFVFIGLSLLAFLWQYAWHRLEDNFDILPWVIRDKDGQAALGMPCPFTGKQPSKRCPCCYSLVHSSAFHIQERLTTFYVGESVLGWDKANLAGNMIESPAKGRELLDEALDWRGNYYFGCTGNGCVGCCTWQRSFRMLPRWALVLDCIACVGALVPWAFRGSLKTVDHGGKVQAIAETYGLYFSLAAVVVQLHSIACAIIFMTTYEGMITFPAPVAVRHPAFLRASVEFLAGLQVSTVDTWQPPVAKTLPMAVKEVANNIASLPALLEKRFEGKSWENGGEF